MPGAPNPLYVAARRVLLDALTALDAHRDAIVLVGAQAVYVHASEADFAIAPFTTDADLAIDPRLLANEPLVEIVMGNAGFRPAKNAIGSWETTVEVEGFPTVVMVDLLVPGTLGGPGRRRARIPPHAHHTARKVAGLEGALVDRDMQTILSLDPADDRVYRIRVAGPAALIVAKVHKIGDRADDNDRLSDKDALDVLRLLRASTTESLVERFARLLRTDVSRTATERAIAALPALFGSARSVGSRMAARAVGHTDLGETTAASIASLAADLISGLR